MVRHRGGCGGAAWLERIASTGSTCPAPSAGASTESTVTRVPTASDTTTARVVINVPESGSDTPYAFMAARVSGTSRPGHAERRADDPDEG